MSSIDEKQIRQWVAQGVITEAQAERMTQDVKEYRKEQSSNKFIVVLSTAGALFLGIGAILFIASNWDRMSDLLKIVLLLGSTVGALWTGYLLRYEKQNLPKVGEALIFLGALLFGASIFLIAQIYNVNANSHALVLLWLAGILPVVYAFHSVPIAALSAVLFYVWLGLFIFRGLNFNEASADFILLPVFYLMAGILLFGLGGLHYFKEQLQRIGRIYRLAGIQVTLTVLYVLTFRIYSGQVDYFGGHHYRQDLQASEQFMAGFIIFSICALISTIINLFYNPSKSETNTWENYISLGLLCAAFTFFFIPPVGDLYTIIFNFEMIGIIMVIIYIGYNREDFWLVNAGMRWAGLFILTKYLDFFWRLLPRSILFMIGGLILVLGGTALEKKRRELKVKFAKVA